MQIYFALAKLSIFKYSFENSCQVFLVVKEGNASSRSSLNSYQPNA